jgi:hypothetical protein
VVQPSDATSARPVSVELPAFEMRPKLVWRLLLPSLGLGVLVAALWIGVPELGLIAVALAIASGVAWRERIIVLGDTAYHRVIRWHHPLLLDHLVDVTLHYEADAREIPHRELRLLDEVGTHDSISLWWFDNWQTLAGSAAEQVLAGRVKPDPVTRKRLARYLRRLPTDP